MIATPVTTSESLDHLGIIPDGYQHEWRRATPQAPIVVPGSVFKWYHVHRDGDTIVAAVDVAARRLIIDEAGAWNLEYGLNFALLHQSVARAFLIVGVWRGHQELWQRMYEIDLVEGDTFRRIAVDGGFTPSACVWEMGVIHHERMAWHRYLFSQRTEADKQAWFGDLYAGAV